MSAARGNVKLFTCVLFFALGVPSSAQAPTSDSILIGKVHMSLGATKSSVLSALQEDYSVLDQGTGSDDFFIKEKGQTQGRHFQGPFMERSQRSASQLSNAIFQDSTIKNRQWRKREWPSLAGKEV